MSSSADGLLFKPEKDYSKDVDAAIPEAEQLASSNNVQAAIEKLSQLEKQARQASDLASTSRVLVAIITISKNSGDWSLLDEQILLLSKKHGQLKQATTKMVQVAMSFIDDAPDMDKKLELIEALRTVTEGKIFVEVERARVTRILSNIKKSQGDLDAAADILCELQVETFGSMERREKTEFILEQVALCIEKGDWTQAGILSRKISTRFFSRKAKKAPATTGPTEAAAEKKDTQPKDQMDTDETKKEDDVTDLKLRYYEQQITLAKHEDKYLDVCKDYRQVLDTESVENNPDQLHAVLQRVIYYILLSPHDNEQSDLLHRIASDSRNTQIVPTDARLLKLFTIAELMRWPIVAEQFGPHLCSTDVFSSSAPASSGINTSATTGNITSAATGAGGTDDQAKAHSRWQALRARVIEHNVRVVASYYTQITLPRLTTLLDLSEDETERYISDLVTSGTVYARIDRPARVVSFQKVRDADEVLNEWSGDIKGLLGLLERIDHLITKEEMMARIKGQGAANEVRAH